MKRMTSVFCLAVMMALCAAGCQRSAPSTAMPSASPAVETPTAEPTPTATPDNSKETQGLVSPTDEPTPAPTPTPTNGKETQGIDPTPVAPSSPEDGREFASLEIPEQLVHLKDWSHVYFFTNPPGYTTDKWMFVFDDTDILIPLHMGPYSCSVYGLKPGFTTLTIITDNGIVVKGRIEVRDDPEEQLDQKPLPGTDPPISGVPSFDKPIRENFTVAVGAYERIVFPEWTGYWNLRAQGHRYATSISDKTIARVAGVCRDGWVVEGLKPGRCTLEIRTAGVTVAECEVTVTA